MGIKVKDSKIFDRKWNEKCLICDSKMYFFFSKKYTEKPYNVMMTDIGKICYYKCNYCGFVFSKTHYELSAERWEKLNFDFHHFSEALHVEKYNEINTNYVSHQPPYLSQAVMIAVLAKNNLIDTKKMLDYAGGYGTLSKTLQKYFDIYLPVYDPYVQSKELKYVFPDESMKFKVVINSAFFEHIRYRSDIDKINSLIDEDGCLILHTVVCEKIPEDSNWFYIEVPVHNAFHTNKSMDILMTQWKYSSSIYSPMSKSWVLFKKEPKNICEIISFINKEMQDKYIYYKQGFVDYWKGF